MFFNVGGGYIADNSSADYGKFIAPVNGTYMLGCNTWKHRTNVMWNNETMNRCYYGATYVLDLVENDQVYLESIDARSYSGVGCGFTGFLLHTRD